MNNSFASVFLTSVVCIGFCLLFGWLIKQHSFVKSILGKLRNTNLKDLSDLQRMFLVLGVLVTFALAAWLANSLDPFSRLVAITTFLILCFLIGFLPLFAGSNDKGRTLFLLFNGFGLMLTILIPNQYAEWRWFGFLLIACAFASLFSFKQPKVAKPE